MIEERKKGVQWQRRLTSFGLSGRCEINFEATVGEIKIQSFISRNWVNPVVRGEKSADSGMDIQGGYRGNIWVKNRKKKNTSLTVA